MNLTVSRDRLFEQPDGTWWFIIHGVDPLNSALGSRAPNRVPPPRLVALAEPCNQGCSFDPTENRRTYPTGSGYTRSWIPCDCADRTLTIETEYVCPGGGDLCGGDEPHVTAGAVSLGPFRIETPVPIVDVESEIDNGRTVDDTGPCVWLADTHDGPQWFHFDGDDQHPIDLGPNPAQFVGQYAVKAVLV